MHVLIVYFIILTLLFLSSITYSSSYTKEELDTLSILFLRPFFLIFFMALVFLYLVIHHFKNKGKSN